MKHFLIAALFLGLAAALGAQESSITVYNQNFAVVRQVIPLDLQQGVNSTSFSDVTAQVEPSSVILRDLNGGALRVLEQNYRNDHVTQDLLLSLNEGNTIQFISRDDPDEPQVIEARIVRAQKNPGNMPPIVEADGLLRFGLPGMPLFPTLGDDTILKPTLDWELYSEKDGNVEAELSYVTGGMSWSADYNLVLPAQGDSIDVVGWITMNNQCGKDFPDVAVQLMAGDVQKIQPATSSRYLEFEIGRNAQESFASVEERAFDEYHLYTLPRRTLLRDRQTKQIEFLRAEDVASTVTYAYDGAKVDWNRYRNYTNMIQDRSFGIGYNKKVAVLREFLNSEENNLGMPMPAGRTRIYRRDEDGRLQFTGEDVIDHTPRDETVRLKSGDAFDLVGERIQTNFRIDTSEDWADESFEITLRNHKDTDVTIAVIEHMYRYHNWEITDSSAEYQKLDSRTVRFDLAVPANGETTMTYQVHYSW